MILGQERKIRILCHGDVMGKTIDLTGQKFGRLTALNIVGKNYDRSYLWLCDCECGKQVVVSSYGLRKGTTKSCGCLQKELLIKRSKKFNEYNLSGEYGIGYTSGREEFYFDLEDFDKIKQYCWYLMHDGYIAAYSSKNKKIFMHRLIMSAQDAVLVDHIHSERKNDNRKLNLRFASTSENCMNKNIQEYSSSGVVGVSYNKHTDRWTASITVRNKRYRKNFKRFEEAVYQRKAWEEEFFKEYSYNNSQKQII